MMILTLNGMRFEGREISLPAHLSNLPDARRFIARAAAAFGFDGAVQEQIKLAVNEAVANAIEHGSAHVDGSVSVRALEEEAGTLAVYVTDAGSFVPRMHRGAMPERGRGLAFMELLMDEVDVRPGTSGTEVRLVKRLDGRKV
jgi:serine/threonine-protein kinase RsbW